MNGFQQEIDSFRERKKAETLEARQIAAFQLACGFDLSAALTAAPSEAAGYVAKLTRLIERERLRGMRRHWSYDLNRHIALKQVLERMRLACAEKSAKPGAA